MRIEIVGGGPAGLYFAILMKRRDHAHEVTVHERNRPDDTFGWGVVFSDETLSGFAEADPALGLQPITALRPAKLVHAMSNSFGFGGNNAVLIFSTPETTPTSATDPTGRRGHGSPRQVSGRPAPVGRAAR